MRAARETGDANDEHALSTEADHQASVLARLREETDIAIIRGLEGEAARGYFGVFGHMVSADRPTFSPDGRTRRPPRDRTNAVLSFLYALLRGECASALEGVGLDPQVGFLHALRPGRPALSLDLMEEFRPVLADRLALTLINRRQLKASDFESSPGGAVQLSEDGRRSVIVAYQKRKEEMISHRLLRQRLPLGLAPHVQARLLARHLRGEIAEYPPFLTR
jgi:CRISPR-associated protein Cas1